MTEIIPKSSQIAYKMYQFVNFCNLMKETRNNNTELSQKWQTDNWHIKIYIRRRWMNSFWDFQNLRVKFLLKSLSLKPYEARGGGGGASTPSSPSPPAFLVRARIKRANSSRYDHDKIKKWNLNKTIAFQWSHHSVWVVVKLSRWQSNLSHKNPIIDISQISFLTRLLQRINNKKTLTM